MRNLKKFLALVLSVMMVMGLVVTANASVGITTSSEVTAKYETAVDVLHVLGLIQGGDGGVYDPKAQLSRVEFATMLYRFDTANTSDADLNAMYGEFGSSSYEDVADGIWYAGAVGYVTENGYMNGRAPGRFNPGEKITGYEAIVVLLRLLGYDKAGEMSGTNYTRGSKEWTTRTGIANDLLSEHKNILNTPVTKDTIAALFFRALQMPYVDYDNGEYKEQTYNYGDKDPVTPGSLLFDMNVVSDADFEKDAKYADLRAADELGRPGYTGALMLNDEPYGLNKPEAVATFDTKKAAGAAADELKAQGITKYAGNAKLVEDGVEASPSNIAGKTIAEAKVGSAVCMDLFTGRDNRVVEIYVDSTTKEITHVIIINTHHAIVAADPDDKGEITLGGLKYKTDEFKKDDHVLYTRGVGSDGAKILTAVKAESFEGTMTKFTSEGVYTIDGTEYTKSDAVAGIAGVNKEMLGVKYTWYYILDGETKCLLGFKGQPAAPDEPEPEVEYGYLLVLANGAYSQVAGNYTAGETAIYVVSAYGVLQDGTTFDKKYIYGDATPGDADGRLFFGADGNDHIGLYRYELDELGSQYLKVTPVAGAQVVVGANGFVAGETSLGGGVTLTGETKFVFIDATWNTTGTWFAREIKGTDITRVGTKNAGKIAKDTKSYVVTEDGVATLVFVAAKWDDAKLTAPAIGDLVYVPAGAEWTRVDMLDENNNKIAAYEYKLIGANGEEVPVTHTAPLTEGEVYEVKDGKIVGLADDNDDVEVLDGVITQVISKTSVKIGGTTLNYSEGSVAYLAGVAEKKLAEGQKVIYVKGFTGTSAENDVMAMWVSDATTVSLTVEATAGEPADASYGDVLAGFTAAVSATTVKENVTNTITVTVTPATGKTFKADHVYEAEITSQSGATVALAQAKGTLNADGKLVFTLTITNVDTTVAEPAVVVALRIKDVTAFASLNLTPSVTTTVGANGESITGTVTASVAANADANWIEGTERTFEVTLTITGGTFQYNHLYEASCGDAGITVGSIAKVTDPEGVTTLKVNVTVAAAAAEGDVAVTLTLTDVTDFADVDFTVNGKYNGTSPRENLDGVDFTATGTASVSRGGSETVTVTISKVSGTFVSDHMYTVTVDGVDAGATAEMVTVGPVEVTNGNIVVDVTVGVNAGTTATSFTVTLSIVDSTEFVAVKVDKTGDVEAITHGAPWDDFTGDEITYAFDTAAVNQGVSKGGTLDLVTAGGTLTITLSTGSFDSTHKYVVSAMLGEECLGSSDGVVGSGSTTLTISELIITVPADADDELELTLVIEDATAYMVLNSANITVEAEGNEAVNGTKAEDMGELTVDDVEITWLVDESNADSTTNSFDLVIRSEDFVAGHKYTVTATAGDLTVTINSNGDPIECTNGELIVVPVKIDKALADGTDVILALTVQDTSEGVVMTLTEEVTTDVNSGSKINDTITATCGDILAWVASDGVSELSFTVTLVNADNDFEAATEYIVTAKSDEADTLNIEIAVEQLEEAGRELTVTLTFTDVVKNGGSPVNAFTLKLNIEAPN